MRLAWECVVVKLDNTSLNDKGYLFQVALFYWRDCLRELVKAAIYQYAPLLSTLLRLDYHVYRRQYPQVVPCRPAS